MVDIELKQKCLAVYSESSFFYNQLLSDNEFFGFKVLYGPPIFRPPILFIGYQPGGGAESQIVEPTAQSEWATECEYATAKWTLARKLQDMFGTELLYKCVGINAIFIRAKSIAKYQASIPYNVRQEIESFCMPRVERLIDILQPKNIVAIGFSSLALFGELSPVLMNGKGRVLIKEGLVGKRRAFATLHLSGAQISNIDRMAIKEYLLTLVGGDVQKSNK